MAAGTSSDFTFYPEQFWAGFTETVADNSDAFNAASANAIRLVSRNLPGDYNKRQFLKQVSMISRRDTTSVSSVSDTAVSSDELIGVKLHRRLGPVGVTQNVLANIGEDQEGYSRLIGEQAAAETMEEQLARVLAALDAALGAQSDLLHDATDGTIEVEDLIDAMDKLGDRAQRIVAWVMHSKVFHNLMKDHVTNAIDSIAGMVIMSGSNPTFGRPVIVTDSASLVVSGSPTNYTSLGLVADAATVIESEERQIATERVTGLANLVHRIQGEHAYNLELKGLKWDTTNGGANPTNSAVGTGGNWDSAASDTKDMPGVRIRSQ